MTKAEKELLLAVAFTATWMAGRGDTARAAAMLSESDVGLSKALLARLLRPSGDMEGAVMEPQAT